MLMVNHLVGFGAGGFTPPPTAYANTGGMGNRAGVITISGTATFAGGSSANLINGSIDNVAFFTTGQTTFTLIFDFGAGAQKYIDEVKWYQDVATANGVWTPGYSNDGTNFTEASSTISFGSSATTTAAVTWPNPDYGRYFRLRQSSGTTSSGPWVQEVEFKISA